MRDVYIIGVDTIKFGKYYDKSIVDLTAMTVIPCLKEAKLDKKDIQAVTFSNSNWGMTTGQTMIRGQVALRPLGIESIPIINVENACAGASTAFHQSWMGVASGMYDITMAVGAEKLYHPNKYTIFSGFMGALPIENILDLVSQMGALELDDEEKVMLEAHLEKYADKTAKGKKKKKRRSIKDIITDYKNMLVVFIRIGEWLGYDVARTIAKISEGDHSPFMDVYGYSARQHMKLYGSTIEQLAYIASKNHGHSTANPNAQYTFKVSKEQVLADRMVTWPLTRGMCAPIGDGSASAILCDEKTVKRLGLKKQAVKVRASVLGSGRDREFDDIDIGERLSKIAYKKAGVGPKDIDCAEVHDATAYGELHQAEALGFCPMGEGGIFAESGATTIGGSLPMNTSGGLESRGHPIGASGLAQIHELTTQLRGDAGKRQVKGAKIALAENGGGALGQEEAAMCVHILEAPGVKSSTKTSKKAPKKSSKK